jgi:hypothetical protein
VIRAFNVAIVVGKSDVVSIVGTATPGVIVASAPLGMTKFKIAAVSVPTFVTLALVPGSPVVVVPMLIVADVPVGP